MTPQYHIDYNDATNMWQVIASYNGKCLAKYASKDTAEQCVIAIGMNDEAPDTEREPIICSNEETVRHFYEEPAPETKKGFF